MSKKYNNYKNNNNTDFNINIEELKGVRVKINNDNNKYLVLFPSDMNFVVQVEDLANYATKVAEEISKNSDMEDLTPEQQSVLIAEKINLTRELITTCKDKFNNVFNDNTAYERIFGNVADIHLIITVINKVYDYVVRMRDTETGTISKYTNNYKK